MKKSAKTATATKAVKKAPVKKAAKAETATKKAPVKKKTATKKAPAKKAADPAPVATKVATRPTTSVIAQIDVGFGNVLFIRGEGPGLTWEKGVPMECRGASEWTWVSASPVTSFPYKLLINDTVWNAGDDYIAAPNQANAITPSF